MFQIARRPRPSAQSRVTLAVLGWAALGLLGATPLGAQSGPIQLFPEAAPGQPGPADALRPQAPTQGSPPGAGATPAPAEGFQVEGLAPPEVDSIGLTGPSEGGFERTLWVGSDPQLVLTLLAALPVTTHNPPLRALTRRLLATGAPLDGGLAGGRVLGARVERLLAMGDLDTAKRLLDQLPPSRGDSALARLAAEAALLDGDDPAACQRASDLAPGGGAEYWAEIAVYCRLAAGDADGARLGLDLLREAGQTEDAAFLQLADAVADGRAEAAVPPLPSPTAVHVALLRLAGRPLPAAALADPSAAVLTVAAREPGLAGDRQLAIAERAFQTGGLAPPALAAIYAEQAPPGDALSGVRTSWGPEARAMAYRATSEQPTPEDLAALLAATWQAAKGEERFLVADAFASRFADLPVDRSLIAVAPSAARALLGADRPLPAARWFALLDAERARDSSVQRDVAALMPLFALAGIGGSEAVPELDAAAVAAWRQATPDADAKAERLFALLDGVGPPVPDAVWWQEVGPPWQRPASLPAGALWRGLDRAASAGRLGETLLFALHMLNGQPAAAHPEVLTLCLRALRALGLDQEARAIAVATALAMDL